MSTTMWVVRGHGGQVHDDRTNVIRVGDATDCDGTPVVTQSKSVTSLVRAGLSHVLLPGHSARNNPGRLIEVVVGGLTEHVDVGDTSASVVAKVHGSGRTHERNPCAVVDVGEADSFDGRLPWILRGDVDVEGRVVFGDSLPCLVDDVVSFGGAERRRVGIGVVRRSDVGTPGRG